VGGCGNKELRRILGSKKVKVTGGSRKLNRRASIILYSSTNIIEIINQEDETGNVGAAARRIKHFRRKS
jgi:hypothetical protein